MAIVNHEVDPISRIEGHLGVKLQVTDGIVTEADVHGNLWRGFENFLIGREPNDAITFTQRICGVCPIPHATASTFANESVIGYNDSFITFLDDGAGKGVPEKALHIRNLVYASEFLMSHITHFYHLAAPSYIQGPAIPPWTPYFADSYYNDLLLSAGHGTDGATGTGVLPVLDHGFSKDLWSAVIKQYVKALRIRRLTFEAGAMFAGRMPMVSSFVAGGVTVSGDVSAKCTKFRTLMTEVMEFIVKEYVPLALALGALYLDYDNTSNVVGAARGKGYGAGVGNFLAWGAFPKTDDTLTIKGAWKLSGSATLNKLVYAKSDVAAAKTLVETNLKEHVLHSRYVADTTDGYDATTKAAYPGDVSRTEPDRTSTGKYSWLKAPRWDGNAMEVGPFARMVVNGYYPVDGSPIRSKFPGYGAYTKTSGAVTGLDPKMVAADLAVALVRSGLAEVQVTSGTLAGTYNQAALAALTTNIEATITSVYTDPNAVIMGTIRDWIYGLNGGLSTMDRLRGRALESLFLVQEMIGSLNVTTKALPTSGGWIDSLAGLAADAPSFIAKAVPTDLHEGFGVSEAPRGALAHFITIDKGVISKYQCVVPTTWNACPKDASGNRGPMEQAMMSIPFDAAGASYDRQKDGTSVPTQGGVEALRIAQSFDPCIACAIH